MSGVLLGASAVAAFAIALFFVRFWLRSKDALHAYFAAAFVLLGIHRLVLAAQEIPSEAHPAIYLLRAAAYLLIIVAVLGKNLGASRA